MKTINKNTCHYPAGLDNPEKGNSHFTRYSGQARVGQNKKAFTLVELIIVITILAILATIAFISFQNYTKDARDGNRVSTITQLQKGLELYTIKTGKYPNPEDIYASGFININSIDETLFEVGYIKEGISRMINFSQTPTDPVSKTNYVYGTSYDNNQYQIATTLENLQTSIIVPTTYANAVQAHVNGNYKGVIKKGDLYSNPESLILPTTYSGGTNLAQNIHFVTDKGQNLPYKINQTTTLTGGTTKTTTGITITKTDWNTLSGSIQTTLGVSPDIVGVMVYGEKEYFSSVKEGGSTETTPDTTPPAGPTCGSAHTSTVASAPTTNLCSDTSTPTVSGTGPWTWTCGTSSCSANKTLAVGDNVSTVSGQNALYAGVYDPTGSNPRTLWVAHAEATGQTISGQDNPHPDLQKQWKTTNDSTSNASNATDGRENTGTFNTNHPASNYCQNLNRAGYTDWYLPAQSTDNVTTTNCSSQSGELQFLYCQHKGTGSQALLGFASYGYCSSTETNTYSARILGFNNGGRYGSGKYYNYRVRCVRVAD